MKAVICIDDNYGMMFNNRRQSKDRQIAEDILLLASFGRLFISPYTCQLFINKTSYINAIISDTVPKDSETSDVLFMEGIDLSEHLDKITSIIIYRWNKKYPGDVFFNAEILNKYHIVSQIEFPGYSHEKITREVWIKNEK